MLRTFVIAAGLASLIASSDILAQPSSARGEESTSFTVLSIFDAEPVEFDGDGPESRQRGELTIRRHGQLVERTVSLPPLPRNQRDAKRIVATVTVEPRLKETNGQYRPGDPWTRLGSVNVVLPRPGADEPLEFETMRFITGFGGPGTFVQDLTPLAPLLAGEVTLQLYVSTYASPGWDVSLSLTYTKEGVGYRRPVFAAPLFTEQSVTAEDNVVRATVVIPEGLDRPRLRVLTTGHAIDGTSGDEFITRTHLLRINGELIVSWRPWAEHGGELRALNPAAGRVNIRGRELWSSDLDRSGWNPGLVVEPLIIPVPELIPGRHEIELEIVDIRPKNPEDEQSPYGYWRVSASVVADEPWPRPN